MHKNAKEKKIFFISEVLSIPFDEGIKNVALSLYKQLEIMGNAVSLTKSGNNTDDFRILKSDLNKLFFNNKLRKYLITYCPDVIIYLPEASITFNSFIRAKVLKLMNSKASVVILGVKHIKYSSFQKKMIAKILKPDLLFLLGKFETDFFLKAGLEVKILPPAVDNIRFCKVGKKEKEKLRDEFNIPGNKIVLLHVGHIRSTRNVECLSEIQKIDNVQVVIVGSTSTVVEIDLKNKLEKEGILIIDNFVADISRIYNMSDIYIFPVFDKIACIDMPLSVLEAMACNLPVITTRFGGLVDYFQEDDGFKYFDTVEELVKLVKLTKDMDRARVHNDKKIEPFTWGRFAGEVIATCNEAI